jgi:mono/diheme cytochrome c family protein
MWRTVLFTPIAIVLMCLAAQAHDFVTTPVTWNREIARVFYSRCVACHQDGGRAFSMTEYKETFPWRTAIKEEVLERRMPPWGAVKGFGDFRNDQALTPEQIELITSWAQGGSPEGDPKDLAAKEKLDELLKESVWFASGPPAAPRAGELIVSGDFKLIRPFSLDGLFPRNIPPNESFQIIAELPDGNIEPLLWLSGYKNEFAHPFLFRTAIELPAGTMISGIPPGATIVLLPVEGGANAH